MTVEVIRRSGQYWGKIVGSREVGKGYKGLIDGKTYVTWRKLDQECGKFNGFGIQYDLFQELKERDVTTIIIVTPDNEYTSSLSHWELKGTIATLTSHWGEQIFLSTGMQEKVVSRG